MKKKIWVEWIGLWGSGKSTCITNYTDSLETNDSKYSFTKDFLAKGRLKKFYFGIKYFTFLFSFNTIVRLHIGVMKNENRSTF